MAREYMLRKFFNLFLEKKWLLGLIVLAGTVFVFLQARYILNIMSGDTLSKTRPNLIYITLDTLRYDHLNVYGYSRETSPNISQLAEDSLVFENAFTVATNSAPSHASMLTGLYPLQHGLVDNGMEISPQSPILTEYLSRKNYDTSAFIGYHAMSEESGLNRGFANFEYIPIASHEHEDKDLEEDTAGFTAFLDWLDTWSQKHPAENKKGESSKPGNFFVWLHVQNIHESYDPPPPYDTLFMPIPPPQKLKGFDEDFNLRCANDLAKAWRNGLLPESFKEPAVALYDGEIRLVDDYLGKIFASLKTKGLYDETMIVLLADHGELHFETYAHQFAKPGPGHTGRYYEPVIRIPLLIKPPKSAAVKTPARSQAMVSTIDLVPTVMEALRFPALPWLPGKSLLQAQDKRSAGDEMVFLQETPYEEEYRVVRDRRWKYIKQVDEQGKTSALLLDLENDPKENRNLLAEQPEKVIKMEAILKEWGDRQKLKWTSHKKGISEEMRKELIAGGYLRSPSEKK
ncbi:MAG: hypothetical protein COV66_05965 [Nitrospinae bacterium CG11_big_fil_rev_8_21_14_0_20_45_15]|nr:MAG: hypothetical protein COV66_05965 [Nitrospinae bacterium CG11_big_fil_rev_8_21_14_0_20_45_15]